MFAYPALKIAIIGASPAGLTLGRLFYLSGINFTIFESEVPPKARSQGGTLDLRDKAGLAAIEAADLRSDFLKLARFDGEALCIADKDMKRYFTVKGSAATTTKKSDSRPEID